MVPWHTARQPGAFPPDLQKITVPKTEDQCLYTQLNYVLYNAYTCVKIYALSTQVKYFVVILPWLLFCMHVVVADSYGCPVQCQIM